MRKADEARRRSLQQFSEHAREKFGDTVVETRAVKDERHIAEVAAEAVQRQAALRGLSQKEMEEVEEEVLKNPLMNMLPELEDAFLRDLDANPKEALQLLRSLRQLNEALGPSAPAPAPAPAPPATASLVPSTPSPQPEEPEEPEEPLGAATIPADKVWAKMSPSEQRDISRLGWSEATWDGSDLDPMSRPWEDLDDKAREAAMRVGFLEYDFVADDRTRPPLLPVEEYVYIGEGRYISTSELGKRRFVDKIRGLQLEAGGEGEISGSEVSVAQKLLDAAQEDDKAEFHALISTFNTGTVPGGGFDVQDLENAGLGRAEAKELHTKLVSTRDRRWMMEKKKGRGVSADALAADRDLLLRGWAARAPAGWEPRLSRSEGEVYFVNVLTEESSDVIPTQSPLPQGWTHGISTTTGKVFFVNPEGESTFDAPTGEQSPRCTCKRGGGGGKRKKRTTNKRKRKKTKGRSKRRSLKKP